MRDRSPGRMPVSVVKTIVKRVPLAVWLGFAVVSPAAAQGPSAQVPFQALMPRTLPELTAPQSPTTICGLRIVPGNPAIDPKFSKDVPKGGPTMTLRRVVPSMCAPVTIQQPTPPASAPPATGR
jgi:hypothetical protein